MVGAARVEPGAPARDVRYGHSVLRSLRVRCASALRASLAPTAPLSGPGLHPREEGEDGLSACGGLRPCAGGRRPGGRTRRREGAWCRGAASPQARGVLACGRSPPRTCPVQTVSYRGRPHGSSVAVEAFGALGGPPKIGSLVNSYPCGGSSDRNAPSMGTFQ